MRRKPPVSVLQSRGAPIPEITGSGTPRKDLSDYILAETPFF